MYIINLRHINIYIEWNTVSNHKEIVMETTKRIYHQNI